MEYLSVHGVPFKRVGRLHALDLPQDLFVDRFQRATERSIAVANDCVVEQLPRKAIYRATWCVYNGNQLMEDEEVYGGNRDRSVDNTFDAAAILHVIWQNDRHPRWIHVHVESIEGDFTIVRLMFSCCFGKQYAPDHPNELFPFFVKLPVLPTPGWKPTPLAAARATGPGSSARPPAC